MAPDDIEKDELKREASRAVGAHGDQLDPPVDGAREVTSEAPEDTEQGDPAT